MSTLREAAQQALEAPGCARLREWASIGPVQRAAVESFLQAALAQREQTCNCRWVGDVQTQQCTLHEAHVDAIHEWAERAKTAEAALAQQEPRNQCGETCERAKLCAVCARGLEQQEQKPYCYAYEYDCAFGVHIQFHPRPYDGKAGPDRAVPLYAHPPRRETEQEPVAWIQPDHLQKARQAPFLCRVEPTKRMSDFVPIYTAPPRREWQSLTEEELAELARQEQLLLICDDSDALREIARAIEQELKERNA
jgi:hypothetical protein